MPAAANRITVVRQLASTLTPGQLEELRLERLRELRATIDALRDEREAHDPLLAWAIGQEGSTQTR